MGYTHRDLSRGSTVDTTKRKLFPLPSVYQILFAIPLGDFSGNILVLKTSIYCRGVDQGAKTWGLLFPENGVNCILSPLIIVAASAAMSHASCYHRHSS